MMRSMPIPRRSHQTASLLRLNKACAEAKGTPLSLRMLVRQATLLKQPLKDCESEALSGRRKRFTGEEKTAGVVGDGERITVLAIAQ